METTTQSSVDKRPRSPMGHESILLLCSVVMACCWLLNVSSVLFIDTERYPQTNIGIVISLLPQGSYTLGEPRQTIDASSHVTRGLGESHVIPKGLYASVIVHTFSARSSICYLAILLGFLSLLLPVGWRGERSFRFLSIASFIIIAAYTGLLTRWGLHG